MSERAAPILPGRLGNPDMTLADDPRADPRMVAALAPLGIGGPVEPFPLTVDHPLEVLHAYADEGEQGFGAVGDVLLQGLDPVNGVTRSVEVILGVDGNDITLYISRPEAADGALPGILHIHGGGMVFLEAAAGNYQRWRDELAVTGLVVVGVEFRNASGKHGPYPFPAGLNDCSSALQWMHDHRSDLGIDKIVVSGESGGGNLTLATTLKAKRDGKLEQIDGVYAQCPYISGAYADPPAELASLTENDTYFIDIAMAGRAGQAVRPGRSPHDEPAGVATARRGGRPRRDAAARDLGQSARPAARRGAGVLPQAGRRRRVRRQPHRQRHVPRRRLFAAA